MGTTDKKHTELSLLFGRKFAVDQAPTPSTPGALELTRKEYARKANINYTPNYYNRHRSRPATPAQPKNNKVPHADAEDSRTKQQL